MHSEIAKRGVDAASAPAVYFASVMKLQTRLWQVLVLTSSRDCPKLTFDKVLWYSQVTARP